uniref:limulus clotting factor C n=1 Tax=Epanerchodus sp. RS-2014 TaxID=1569310 RepID=A0A0E4B7Z5_9MYRI|nr:limulus clotting factor C-like [Epanerchodus sp. RS-2014]
MATALIITIISTLCLFAQSARVDVGLCNDWNFQCSCGSSYQFSIPIKQCSSFYRWKLQCKPCSDFNENTLCSKYVHCLECNRDQCTKCPVNRYGQWCSGVCQCQNGGTCNNDGVCFCPAGYTGPQCQIQKCLHPESMPNTDVSLPNTDVGSTATYSCQPGYSMAPNSNNLRVCGTDGRWSGHAPHCQKRCPTLSLPSSLTSDPDINNQSWFVQSTAFKCPANLQILGPISINCLSNGEWDSPPPRCVSPCPVPASVENGHAFYQTQELVDGGKVRFVCARDYRIVGEKEATCMSGNWSHPPPTCEKILYCTDPGVPEFGERQTVRGVGDDMSVGTKVTYSCTKGSILIGPSEATCLDNATWTNGRPTCVFVSNQEITCETKGSDVVAANHAPLRISCPDECQKNNPPIWGTVIYKKDSRICASAIHAGMIPSEGGSVFVVNNGIYNQFVPSSSNGIKTKRLRGAAESYRFNYVDPEEEETKCPSGWSEIGEKCVVYVDKATDWKEAKSICKNLNSHLVELATKNETEQIRGLMKSRMASVNKERIWSSNLVTFPTPPLIKNNETVIENRTDSNSTLNDEPKKGIEIKKKTLQNDTNCSALDIKVGNIQKEDCQQKLNFFCATNAREIEPEGPVCDEPPAILHGSFQIKDETESIYSEGTIVKYKCQSLYYLSGKSEITCTSNATWNTSPPKCIRAAACSDPPPVNNGFFDVVPEPRVRVSTSPSVQTPKKLTAAEKHLAESEKATVPSNYHRVNTKIQFECESRYYKLIGSSTRTCMADSTWSGRQPSCQPVCGSSSAPRSPFVVGGKPSIAGQWPWQVGIARKIANEDATGPEDEYIWYLACGAALLTESWVVTAAHCVAVEGTAMLVEPKDLKLYFGKYYRNDTRDDSEVQIREVESIQMHPNFNPVIYDGDIALIHLKTPVKLSGRVQPVCLPDPYSGMSDRHLKAGTIATVTGWGRNSNNETPTYPELLMHAEVRVVSSEECEKGYQLSDIPLSVTGNMFCAGNDNSGGKTDACSGDSGGPLVVADGTGVNEKWYLEGIVSWGSPRGCGMDREYGGYTKVSIFLEWIKQYI